MKAIAIIFALLAAALGAVGLGGAPQQIVAAGVVGILALAFWGKS